MADNVNKNQDFSSYGTESFKLGDDLATKEEAKVVLNIQEETVSPILLETGKQTGYVMTGNPFVDTFNRINRYLASKSKVKIDVKANFFHLLSVMINAGIPMVKALNSLKAQNNKSPKMQMVIEELSDKIVSGSSLSVALLDHPDVFLEQEIGMIQAGEASGQLSKTLEVIAHDTEKASAITKKVKSALMYPSVIFTLLIAVVSVMLVFVIPKLTELFSSTGGDLPLITRIVVGLSDFLINKKIVLIGGIAAIILAFILAKKTEKGRYFLDKMKLKIPIFGGLLQKTYLSRFARSLSNLLDSSVSIVKTLEITASSVGNEVYKKRLLLSMEDIKQGIPLAENLSESDLFPQMLVSMIEVGEQTAQLDDITGKVADFYETEVDTQVEGLSKVIEPIMLVVIGLTVGAIVAAIILPIMKLTDMAGSL